MDDLTLEGDEADDASSTGAPPPTDPAAVDLLGPPTDDDDPDRPAHDDEIAAATVDGQEPDALADAAESADDDEVAAAEHARSLSIQNWVGWTIVLGASLLVFISLNPPLLLTDSTATGGDMGAHVWGPRFLMDHLLPSLRVTGWTPDWYAGFPAYMYYMVVPSLFVVWLSFGSGMWEGGTRSRSSPGSCCAARSCSQWCWEPARCCAGSGTAGSGRWSGWARCSSQDCCCPSRTTSRSSW